MISRTFRAYSFAVFLGISAPLMASWGAEMATCPAPEGTFPLDAAQLQLLGADPKTFGKPLSDADIVTPSDVSYCKGPLTNVSSTITEGQTLPDDGSVWRVGSNRWNMALEEKYAQWVANEIDSEFFVRYQIPTDCTDAAFTVRAIFARIHHLPVAFDTEFQMLGNSQKQYSQIKTIPVWNESNWKQSLKEDKRFLAFLNDARGKLSTKNINQSTYPVEISECSSGQIASPYLTAGKLLLDSHHIRFISKVDTKAPYEPIQEMSSTVPMDVRTLHQGFPTLRDLPQNGMGLLGWRWPVNCGKGFMLTEKSQMFGFSEEQYSMQLPAGKNFSDYISSLVPGERKPADMGYLDLKWKQLENDMATRADIIEKAQALLAKDPKVFDDPSSQIYDDYSTPSRDQRMTDTYHDLANALKDPAVAAELEKRLRSKRIDLGNGKWVDWSDYFEALMNKKISSHPKLSREDRWGFTDFIQGGLNHYRESIKVPQERLKKLEELNEAQIQALSPAERVLHDQGTKKTPAEIEIIDVKMEIDRKAKYIKDALERGAK